MVSAQKLLAILFILSLSIPLAFAADMLLDGEELLPTVIIKYQGSRAITDSLSAKSVGEKPAILAASTKNALKDWVYPYPVDAKVTILKYKCTDEICGYWVSCTRDGGEVYTNSPIWISPPPYEVVVSESFDEKTNELTVTLKEDPKTAVEQILQGYVERQPLGKAVSYER